jgi:acetyltransferase-like isoleucine patch superfamily enzyme
MAQKKFLSTLLIHKLSKWAADFVTPDENIVWRWELRNVFLRQTGLEIGKGVAIDRDFTWLKQGGKITFEDNAAVGMNASIYNFGEVSIGKFVMCASDIIIANGGHETDTFEPFSGPIRIGNGVWIGTNARVVGSNINIGDNAIIGAGALVIEDVPSGTIVGGVPAKVIGKRNLPAKVWHYGEKYFCPRTFLPLD